MTAKNRGTDLDMKKLTSSLMTPDPIKKKDSEGNLPNIGSPKVLDMAKRKSKLYNATISSGGTFSENSGDTLAMEKRLTGGPK